jgi:hypothetical protein
VTPVTFGRQARLYLEAREAARMIEMLSNAGIVALLSLVVGVLPLGLGMAYAARPTEQRLALMRPVSLASIFAGLSGSLSGAINVLRMLWISDAPVETRILAVGAAESLVPLLVAFGSLTVAWLCAAVGLRRHS